MMGRRVIELYDALITGNDWEVTPYLSLKRRAGHTSYCTIGFPALFMYDWKSNTMGTIPVIDTTGDVEYLNTATQTSVQITTKSTSSQAGILGIGNYLYMGNTTSNLKFDGPSGPQGVTNWGIAEPTVPFGPDQAGTITNPGTPVWVNPSNITSSVAFATVTLTGNGAASGPLLTTNYGFSITAGATITGILITFNAKTSNSTSGIIEAQLLINGSTAGTASGTGQLSTTSEGYGTGSQSFLFNYAWTQPLIDNSTFGVQITAVNQFTGTATYSVNDLKVYVYAQTSPTATPTGSGTFTAVNGYTYVYAYGNTVSGEISNALSPGANTGPFTNVAYVGVPVVASSDPQVNQIRVYRTTDSGGGNQFFEISNSPFPNTTATIQDTTPDTSLQVTSQAEINLGNTPPPQGLINLCWFAGRMWGSVNNVLFASTGAETISGTAPNSNWNPLFQWVIPGYIVTNIAGPNGMLVFTQDDCYIVRGTDITNYTVNEFIKDFAVRSYNCVDTDGTNLYVFTSDRQFIIVSSSGANDIGLAIADQLLNINPNYAYVTVNRYALDSIVRILDTVNNIYFDYNLNQQCWNLPGILKMPDCTAAGSIEVTPGVWRLMLCSTNSGVSTLAYRDITNFQDLGVSYSPQGVFGSIQVADPGTLAKIGARGGFVFQYTLAGVAPGLAVLANDIGCTLSNPIGSQITGTFTNLTTGVNPFPIPPTLGNKPVGFRNLGYYYSVGKNQSAFVQSFQLLLSAPAENTATELLGFGVFGDLSQEVETAGAIPQIQGR